MGHIPATRSGRLVTSLILASTILFLTAASSMACIICQSVAEVTMGQKLDWADQAVLAVPLGEQGRFRIVEVIKGNVDDKAVLIEPSRPAAKSTKPLLMLRNGLAKQWENLGMIGAEQAPWLRLVAGIDRSTRGKPVASLQLFGVRNSLTEAEWIERVAVVAANLESADPLAAEIAYGEIARAPYSALRSLSPQLDVKRISAWIDDPKLVSRRSGYTLLLGIAGGSEEAARLETRLGDAWLARDAANLSAMLTAELELRGSGRVAWIEEAYFADRQRTLPEINAALLALSVHGEADATVPRERVIEAYRHFIKQRPPMAGFVAMELASWKAWDATADFVEIIRSKAVKDPASQFAILSYLKSSPLTAEQAALLPAAE